MEAFRILAAIASLLLPSAVWAATLDEVPVALRGHWQAESNTATALTGNISITRSEIIFQNGARVTLSYIGKRDGLSLVDSHLHSDIFRLRATRNVRLLNGNTICSVVPDYLVLTMESGSVTGKGLELAVITGKKSPLAQFDPNRTCATFSFVAAQSKPGK
jgi:hypothetical protein